MKVKELKAWLEQFQDEEEIVITAMDDYFSCQDFSLHSPYDNGQAQEIILPYYFERYLKESENPNTDITDLTGVYTEE